MLSLVIKDLLDFKIFKYWLISLFITIAVIAILVIMGIMSFASLVNPLSDVGLGIIPLAYQNYWLDMLQSTINFLVGSILTVIIALASWFSFSIVLLFALGLFNESIIKAIRDKHYPDVELMSGFSIWPMVVEQTKIILIYLCLLILGAIGYLIFAIIFSWTGLPLLMIWGLFLYRSLLMTDCGLSIFSLDTLRKQKEFNKNEYWSPVISTYIASLVPFLNVFSPIIAVVWLSHLMLSNKKETLAIKHDEQAT